VRTAAGEGDVSGRIHSGERGRWGGPRPGSADNRLGTDRQPIAYRIHSRQHTLASGAYFRRHPGALGDRVRWTLGAPPLHTRSDRRLSRPASPRSMAIPSKRSKPGSKPDPTGTGTHAVHRAIPESAREITLVDGSAFIGPRRRPKHLQELTVAMRKRLVGKLIPDPGPAPREALARILPALDPRIKRFHGIKIPLTWLPPQLVFSPCSDKFGYMFSAAVRNASKLPFDLPTQALLTQLGNLTGDPARDAGPDSTIAAGGATPHPRRRP
jgi:hypothetical protein